MRLLLAARTEAEPSNCHKGLTLPRPGGRRAGCVPTASAETKTISDTNGGLDEQELDKLEERIRAAGWTLIGFVPSGKQDVPGIWKAARPGTRNVEQASVTPKGLLAAIDAFERAAAVTKEDVDDIRREENDGASHGHGPDVPRTGDVRVGDGR